MKTFILSLLLVVLVIGPVFANNDIQPGSPAHNQRSEYPAMTVTVHNGNILIASPQRTLLSIPILCYGTLAEMDAKAGLHCHNTIPRPEPPALRVPILHRAVGMPDSLEGGSEG